MAARRRLRGDRKIGKQRPYLARGRKLAREPIASHGDGSEQAQLDRPVAGHAATRRFHALFNAGSHARLHVAPLWSKADQGPQAPTGTRPARAGRQLNRVPARWSVIMATAAAAIL